MSEIPETLHYTEEHEYLKPTDDGSIFQVGITDYAQGELGDVVYVDLPKPGTKFARSVTNLSLKRPRNACSPAPSC